MLDSPLISPSPGPWPQHGGNPDAWRYHHNPSWSMSLSNFASNFGGQVLVVALIVMLAAVAAFLVRRRRGWIFAVNPAATCLAVGSLAAIAVSTLTPRSNAGSSSGHVQLVPLATLRQYLNHPADLLIYVGGNIAMFIPLGFFLYLALAAHRDNGRPITAVGGMLRWSLISTVACAVVSAGVEVLQVPIWSRSSDVDDVLTNTFGGLLGAVAGVVALYLIRSWSARRPTSSRPGRSDQKPEDPAERYAVGSRAS